ncbi:uncharacterized protein AC631_04047 [Debaryomyces fabryi]|uniref:Thioredoxin domain-containing protein n=1 Tax=Debaryomyces fabryi TaxID=58627 RepID=A0A0V1PW64_9ASCO|nr:uncharacterized protein AC631_04047 [Debaryomyces fabryi]KSA00207.1 hypothetical protein AC631_04047 [Debaryomyces fabryi]CUM48583.1 unnamed protein product [Debaryomyces fabryi]
MKLSFVRAAICFTLLLSALGKPAAIGKGGSLELVADRLEIEKDVVPDVDANVENEKPSKKIGQETSQGLESKSIKEGATLEEEGEVDVKPKVENSDVQLPEELTLADFAQSTSSQLSFVEFYSPYCSHCKQLAPTWEATYKEFYPEMKELNIQMRQVNCIESGDLCDKESVDSFPSLRLYVPDTDKVTGDLIPGKLRFVGSFPRSLMRTSDNFKKYMKNAVAEYDSGAINLPSSSQLLTVDELLKVVAGDIEQAHFVAFFPSYDKQWKESDSQSKNLFPSTCVDCYEYKQIWGRLSNQILSTVKSAHVNCRSNPNICEKLGFKDLTTGSGRPTLPKFAMFLPEKTGIVRFDYKGAYTLSDLKAFASRLYESSQYEKISATTLSEIMEYKNNLPFEPLKSYYPLNNKVSVVFYYDEETVTEEDRAILPYLLEYVMKSPFNVYLYTAKNKKFERNVVTQAENLVQFINYDEDAPPKKFNKAMHLATTLTAKPTILVYRDNTLFTSIYQNFAPEDMRNHNKIEEFIKKNQFPLYQELTPELIKHYFNPNKEEAGADKVVVTFINSEDARTTNEALYNMSLIAHDYYSLKQEYYFNDMTKRREEKAQNAARLQQKNADSVKVIKEMRKKVPHFFDSHEVLFTFIDVCNHPNLAQAQGWDISKANYKPGDAIIVTKDDRKYWDTNIFGKKLTNDPYELKPVLQYLLDPELLFGKVHERDVRLKSKLVGSPYGDSFRFMDTVHQHGFFGYIFFLIAAYTLVAGVRKYLSMRRKSASRTSNGLGILGNLDKKD